MRTTNEYGNTDARKKEKKTDEEVFTDREEMLDEEAGDKMAEDEHEDEEQDDLRRKYDELNNSYLRLNAEFDNFRKRTLKEKTDLIKSGGERVLLDIIALVDDFERALESFHETEEKDAILEGMNLIYTKFIAFLKQHGVNEIEAIGQPFNADTFEAITAIPVSEESQKGVVLDCIRKGYRLNDKIIRFPKVIVGE